MSTHHFPSKLPKMKKLLESDGDGNVDAHTPKASRKIVTPEKGKQKDQEQAVQHDAFDEASPRFEATRTKQSDAGEEEYGTLVLGRTAVIWMRNDENVAFAHPFVALEFYGIKNGKFVYIFEHEKKPMRYEYHVNKPEELVFQLDKVLLNNLRSENDKERNKRLSSGSRSRGSSITKVGMRVETDGRPKRIQGIRIIGRLLGKDKHAFWCILFVHSDALVILDDARGVLRVFDWENLSDIVQQKEKLGQAKGRVTFTYFLPDNSDDHFDLDVRDITMCFPYPEAAVLALNKGKLEADKGAMGELPTSYP